MDLKFSKMSVDTSLAQECLKNDQVLFDLYNDYDGTLKKMGSAYDGVKFLNNWSHSNIIDEEWKDKNKQILLNMATKLKEHDTYIAQLEYYIRKIPVEVTKTQLSLLIKYIECHSESGLSSLDTIFHPNEPLLKFGSLIGLLVRGDLLQTYGATAPLCHFLVTLLREAGANHILLVFLSAEDSCYTRQKALPVKGLDSGTVAVVSDDADVDSAVDKFISVPIQAPWRLTRILVQESVYSQFKDALRWKCNLQKSESKPSDVLSSDTLTYNDKTFLIDPVELSEEKPTIVKVEAYRTTKEMISLVQQYNSHYLSLWLNGIAEINEVTHSTKSPVVWVNNLADFRGPSQVSDAVFSYVYDRDHLIQKCDKVSKLCEISQSWLKLDIESRRDRLCDVLNKFISLNAGNEILYSDIKNSLLKCTLDTFVDVGKDYVCIGMTKPVGIMITKCKDLSDLFSIESFKSILIGNPLVIYSRFDLGANFLLLEQAGIPVVQLENYRRGDFPVLWKKLHLYTRTRVIWTNSGTIFAN